MMMAQDEPVIRVPRKLSGPTVQVLIFYLFVLIISNLIQTQRRHFTPIVKHRTFTGRKSELTNFNYQGKVTKCDTQVKLCTALQGGSESNV